MQQDFNASLQGFFEKKVSDRAGVKYKKLHEL